MPRYYFTLTDGKQVLSNHKGLDLAGNAAVLASCPPAPHLPSAPRAGVLDGAALAAEREALLA